MMRDRPSGAELMALAAELAGPGDEALVERCRAIAAREARLGDAGWHECHAALRAIYGDGDAAALFHRLARDIRAGGYDTAGAARDAVRGLLRQVTRRKLGDANPDFMRDEGLPVTPLPRCRV